MTNQPPRPEANAQAQDVNQSAAPKPEPPKPASSKPASSKPAVPGGKQ